MSDVSILTPCCRPVFLTHRAVQHHQDFVVSRLLQGRRAAATVLYHPVLDGIVCGPPLFWPEWVATVCLAWTVSQVNGTVCCILYMLSKCRRNPANFLTCLWFNNSVKMHISILLTVLSVCHSALVFDCIRLHSFPHCLLACVSSLPPNPFSLSGLPLAYLRTRSSTSLTCLEQQIHARGTVHRRVA